MFAIVTFRNTGPIKTWSDMRAANVHNARTKPLDHAVLGAPGPQFLVGTNDLVADVRRHLRASGISPDRLRKNGVIAYEAILSASPKFFEQGDAAARAERLQAWTHAQVAWAMKRYGPHRAASMVLHVDEKTPHVHLVVLPLEVKPDGRRNDGAPRWSLVGRTISGPGRFNEVQDDYADAMAAFGLERGARGSRRKHEPVPVYLARMAEKERAVDDERKRNAAQAEAVERGRQQVLAADQDLRAREAQFEALVLEADRLHKERWDKLDHDRAEFEGWRKARAATLAADELALANEQAALVDRQASFARFRDELVATRERLAPIFEAAKAFTRAAQGVDLADVMPAARPAVETARRVVEANRMAHSPQPIMPQQVAGKGR